MILLLKEVSKCKEKVFGEYLSEKILTRIFKILSTSKPEQCMREFSSDLSSKESKDFYQILLECMQNWSGIYGSSCLEIIRYSESLSRMGKLPVKEEFWNYPQIKQTSDISEEISNSPRKNSYDVNNNNEKQKENAAIDLMQEIGNIKRSRI